MNHNSANNQRICGKLVGREVVTNVSYLIQHFLKQNNNVTEQIFDALYVEPDFEEMGRDAGYVEDTDGDIYSFYGSEKYSSWEDAGRAMGFKEAPGEHPDDTIIIHDEDDSTFHDDFDEAARTGNGVIKAIELDDGIYIADDNHWSSWQDLCENELEYDQEMAEVYEWWIVTDWFANKLKAKGEIILEDFFNLTIWGRQGTGQAILLDWVVGSIAEDMEILEGQVNEWRDL